VKLSINERRNGGLSDEWNGTTISVGTVAGAIATGLLARMLKNEPMLATI
jgi:hypothetical protein